MLRFQGIERQLYGGEADTTNNRMELQAAIEALVRYLAEDDRRQEAWDYNSQSV